MSEPKPPDNKDPNPDAADGLSFGSLEELDAELARAADAAKAITEEAGATAPSDAQSAPIDTSDVPSPEDVLSQELARLEGLVATAAIELGVDPATLTPTTPVDKLDELDDALAANTSVNTDQAEVDTVTVDAPDSTVDATVLANAHTNEDSVAIAHTEVDAVADTSRVETKSDERAIVQSESTEVSDETTPEVEIDTAEEESEATAPSPVDSTATSEVETSLAPTEDEASSQEPPATAEFEESIANEDVETGEQPNDPTNKVSDDTGESVGAETSTEAPEAIEPELEIEVEPVNVALPTDDAPSADSSQVESQPSRVEAAQADPKVAPAKTDPGDSNTPHDIHEGVDAGIATEEPSTHEAPDAPQSETDAGLDELDALLAEASGQGGDIDEATQDNATPAEMAAEDEEPQDASTAQAEAPANAAKPEAADAVPDFMREFMDDGDAGDSTDAATTQSPPKAAAASSSKPADTSKFQPSGKPGVVGTGMLGVVGSAPSAPAEATPTGEQPDGEPEDTDSTGSSDGEADANAERRPALARIATRLAPLGLLALNGLAVGLEHADRPFRKIGPRLRTIIGWVALATMGTAMIVVAMALL